MQSIEELKKNLAVNVFWADQGGPTILCINCGHEVFWEKSRRGKRPGHIYSEAGLKEYKISGMCEYCFDKLMEVEDDEEEEWEQ